MRLFVSLFAYAFGKMHWPNVDAAAALEMQRGEASTVPGFRTLHRLRKFVDELELHTDHSTLIARARDRAAGRFLRSSCDQWIAIDDDVDADDRACVGLLTTRGQNIVSLAMRMRTGDHGFNVVPLIQDGGVGRENLFRPSVPFRVSRVGMGMIRIPRDELHRVATWNESNVWDEPDPVAGIRDPGDERPSCPSPGVFLPMVRGRQWLDDDWSFCDRARDADVDMYAVILPGVTHAGIPNISKPTPPSRL